MIEIVKCLPGCTVQDMGRSGYRRLGVGSSGAVDQLSLITGNTLLGNTPNAAGLEILLFPIVIRFLRDCSFSVTGAPNQASLDGVLLPPCWKSGAKAGQILRVDGTAKGGINYLCIAGGFLVPTVLGSASTDLKGAFGGLEGRMLQASDVLDTVHSGPSYNPSSFGAAAYPSVANQTLRVLPGFELQALNEQQQELFLSSTWTVSRQSNRIGYRLEGPSLAFDRPIELLSYGFVPGLVQLPPSGQPIVMLADAQTSGGYPRLGSIIDSDLRLLAQSAPGTPVQLRACTLNEALAAERDEHRFIDQLRRLREIMFP